MVLATKGAGGPPDASPKGDPAGVVAALDRNRLAAPDRLGDNRFVRFESLFDDPAVALLFLIPGMAEAMKTHAAPAFALEAIEAALDQDLKERLYRARLRRPAPLANLRFPARV